MAVYEQFKNVFRGQLERVLKMLQGGQHSSYGENLLSQTNINPTQKDLPHELNTLYAV